VQDRLQACYWLNIASFVPSQRGEATNFVSQELFELGYIFFLNSHSGGWSPSWVHSARRPLNGLLYLPAVIMIMEN
jgi:hypothetical protein